MLSFSIQISTSSLVYKSNVSDEPSAACFSYFHIPVYGRVLEHGQATYLSKMEYITHF